MFLYEMHQHTAGCSACGVDSPVETVRGLKQAGFAGMVLTNHFYHGNTGIRRHQEWADFVRPYEEAWLEARHVAEDLDFDVLFGIEEGVGDGKEVLLYGITPALLYEHPELRQADLSTISSIVHEAGGLVMQAHPFRVRDYIARPWEELDRSLLDGMEVHNACNGDLENMRAKQAADRYGLLPIAGSDAHVGRFPGRAGIATPYRLTDEAALVSALRKGQYSLYINDRIVPLHST